MSSDPQVLNELFAETRRKGERLIKVETKTENLEQILKRIEEKLDHTIANHDKLERKVNYLLALVTGGAFVIYGLYQVMKDLIIR